MDGFTSGIFGLAAGVLSLAIIALVIKNAQGTSSVIQSSTQGFASVIQAASAG